MYPFSVSISAEAILNYKNLYYKDISQKLSLDEIEKLAAKAKEDINNFLKISQYLIMLNFIENNTQNNKLKILIYTNFFLGWLYIIISSLPFLSIDINYLLGFIEKFCDSENPFSSINNIKKDG